VCFTVLRRKEEKEEKEEEKEITKAANVGEVARRSRYDQQTARRALYVL